MKIIIRCLIIIALFSVMHNPAFAQEIFNSSGEILRADLAKPALTLVDCYNLSLKQSETIAINTELIKEAEARFTQALSGLLPHVSFSVNETWRQSAGASGLSPKSSSERKFVFTQTLFSGFKEFAGIAGSRHEQKQYKAQKLRAEQLLFSDVSDAFYLLSELREDLKILKDIRKVLIGRILDIKEREAIGRSRRSEVVNTEAQLYILEAELELVKSGEAVARQLLEFLTGIPIEAIQDLSLGIPDLQIEDSYLAKVDSRPDVYSAYEAWQVAKEKLTIARSGLYPDANLEGNYYEHQATSLSNSDWDVALKIDVPIFEGTLTYGQIKEASAVVRQSELEYAHTKRRAILDIRDSYVRIEAGVSRTKALRKALAASTMNYHLQRKDYELSLINNLDVLDAIQSMSQVRRTYSQALYNTKRLYWQLLVAAGEIDLEKLK